MVPVGTRAARPAKPTAALPLADPTARTRTGVSRSAPPSAAAPITVAAAVSSPNTPSPSSPSMRMTAGGSPASPAIRSSALITPIRIAITTLGSPSLPQQVLPAAAGCARALRPFLRPSPDPSPAAAASSRRVTGRVTTTRVVPGRELGRRLHHDERREAGGTAQRNREVTYPSVMATSAASACALRVSAVVEPSVDAAVPTRSAMATSRRRSITRRVASVPR